MNEIAPIVLFVYNRPEHTRMTVEALMKNELASESVLYVFADGPKENATREQIAKIQAVREYIHTIKGFKDIIIEESAKNKGLANSVIAGVTKVINQYGRVIVVEDDLVTCPHFLRLINEELEAYKYDKRIFMVGGYNYNIKIPWYYWKDVYIVHRSNSTGWGCWKDRWECADWSVPGYEDFLKDSYKQMLFNRGGNDMTRTLKMQMAGTIDSWAIRWDYCMYMNDAYCVYPTKSFLWNSGFDGSGVHSSSYYCEELTAPLYLKAKYKIHLPKTIKPIRSIEKKFKEFQEGNRNIHLFHIIANKMRRCIRKLFCL